MVSFSHGRKFRKVVIGSLLDDVAMESWSVMTFLVNTVKMAKGL